MAPRGGLERFWLASESIGSGSSPDWSHCVVLLNKTAHFFTEKRVYKAAGNE